MAEAGAKVKDFDEVEIKFTASLEDGRKVETGAQMSFVVGAGEVLPGIDQALKGMQAGEVKDITLPPKLAYGERREEAIKRVPTGFLPPGAGEGSTVRLGQVEAVVQDIVDGFATVDANPPLAGKTLIFEIELLQIKDAPVRGMDMVGWGGKSVHVPIVAADSPVSKVFEKPSWPTAWPYEAKDFTRQDETDDENFYDTPRFVAHIDDGAIAAIKNFYDIQFSQAPQG